MRADRRDAGSAQASEKNVAVVGFGYVLCAEAAELAATRNPLHHTVWASASTRAVNIQLLAATAPANLEPAVAGGDDVGQRPGVVVEVVL